MSIQFILGVIVGIIVILVPAILIIRTNKKKFSILAETFKAEAKEKIEKKLSEAKLKVGRI